MQEAKALDENPEGFFQLSSTTWWELTAPNQSAIGSDTELIAMPLIDQVGFPCLYSQSFVVVDHVLKQPGH